MLDDELGLMIQKMGGGAWTVDNYH